MFGMKLKLLHLPPMRWRNIQIVLNENKYPCSSFTRNDIFKTYWNTIRSKWSWSYINQFRSKYRIDSIYDNNVSYKMIKSENLNNIHRKQRRTPFYTFRSYVTDFNNNNTDKKWSKIIPGHNKNLNPVISYFKDRKFKDMKPKFEKRTFSNSRGKIDVDNKTNQKGTPLQNEAGRLYNTDEEIPIYIPQVALHSSDGRRRKRILVLCTGGTLTMKADPSNPDKALIPIEGALSEYMRDMKELQYEQMPEVVCHEYSPLLDSADLGPNEWAVLAKDINTNYHHFDGFVVLMGTDTMAYAATALSFMLENLGKAVVFTGSQIPLSEPYNDARRNLIMALIFASRDTICEVSIFFHDRLIRACRATKVDTHRLSAFDSPNMEPLAKIGITIDENRNLLMPQAKGALRTHTRLDTKIISLRLVPGYDDDMIQHMIDSATETNLKALVLQLYGTGNLPSVKNSIIQCLHDAKQKGILVVASTQCFTGSVLLGHYATGRALKDAGVVSAADMTLEAISCKLSYLFGRGDLTSEEIGSLIPVSLRGEVTPAEALSPPPLSNAFQRSSRKGKQFY